MIKFDLGNSKRLFVVGYVVNNALLRYVQCVTDIWMPAVNIKVKYRPRNSFVLLTKVVPYICLHLMHCSKNLNYFWIRSFFLFAFFYFAQSNNFYLFPNLFCFKCDIFHPAVLKKIEPRTRAFKLLTLHNFENSVFHSKPENSHILIWILKIAMLRCLSIQNGHKEIVALFL